MVGPLRSDVQDGGSLYVDMGCVEKHDDGDVGVVEHWACRGANACGEKQFRGSGQFSAARAQWRRRFLHAKFLSGSSIRLYDTMRVRIEPYQRT
jgi:hypothetical protein